MVVVGGSCQHLHRYSEIIGIWIVIKLTIWCRICKIINSCPLLYPQQLNLKTKHPITISKTTHHQSMTLRPESRCSVVIKKKIQYTCHSKATMSINACHNKTHARKKSIFPNRKKKSSNTKSVERIPLAFSKFFLERIFQIIMLNSEFKFKCQLMLFWENIFS